MMKKDEKIFKKIKKSLNVFIMGHKNLDLDALGSSIAIGYLCKRLKKDFYIIIEDNKHEESIKKALKYIEKNINYKFGTFKDFEKKYKENSLVIILDTYSEKQSQCPKLCLKSNNKIIIDHHLFGKPLEGFFINSKVSSTCEMIATIFYNKHYRIPKEIATMLLAGIIIDSNGYCNKTTAKTMEIVTYLFKRNADNNMAHSFNRTKIAEYKTMQNLIFKTSFFKKKYAFIICEENKIYERELLAKICNSLLNFENIEAGFVIGKIDKETINICARSINIDVASILKKFGGGGHYNNAAAQIKESSLLNLKNKIKEELK